MGIGVTVALRFLVPSVQVQILDPQLNDESSTHAKCKGPRRCAAPSHALDQASASVTPETDAAWSPQIQCLRLRPRLMMPTITATPAGAGM